MNREHEAEADRLIRELNERSAARRAAEAVEEPVAGDPLERGLRSSRDQQRFNELVARHMAEGQTESMAREQAGIELGISHGDVVWVVEPATEGHDAQAKMPHCRSRRKS